MTDEIVEEWRPVVGLEGRYEVSSSGRARSIKKDGSVRVLKPSMSRDQYLGFIVIVNGRPVRKSVHRIMAEAFLSIPPGMVVDHINGNKIDNRLCNLRIATTSQNTWNAGKRKRNTSGYKGVTWSKSSNKWQAQMGFHGKKVFLGLFHTAEEASAAYCTAAIRLHGEFFKLE